MAYIIRYSNVDPDNIPRICINVSVNLNSKGWQFIIPIN
jgi:hypothetical protein